MAPDLLGNPSVQDADAAAQDGLPEPPAPEGPGLFGDPDPPPAAIQAPTTPAAPATGPYRVLARKYRPTNFDDLIGQEALVRTLRNAFAQGRVHHAFLLTGVRGVGKTTTARIIARALNCVGVDGKGGPTVDPCGVCAECRAILADRHPDVTEMDAASNNSVDDVRELREALRFRPAQARQKVFILDECHMLSGAAFNALLKTLEEPPPSVTFVLATTELRKVPVTIRSRCQTFSLRRVPVDVLRGHFGRIAQKEAVEVEDEALGMVARAADGSVRDGLSLLDQAIGLAGGGTVTGESVRDMLGLADRFMVYDLMEAVMGGDVAAALAILDRTHEVGADPLAVLQDLADFTHLLTRFRAAPALKDDATLPEAERTRGAALALRLSVPTLGRAWQMLLKGIAEVQQEGIDRRAAAEMVLIRLAHVADLPTPGEIVKRLTETGGTDAAPRPSPGGGSGGLRAMAGGGAVAAMAPAPAPSLPQPREWREVVALASGVQPMLHANLLHYVHPVRIAPGRVEIRPEPAAPRDLAAQLTGFLADRTGLRWTVTISNEEGEPTLAQQGRSAESDRLEAARSHPVVQAILAAFPGTTIEAVRDAAADDYGLVATPAAITAEPDDDGMDGRDFAPPEAETAWSDDDSPNDD
ncbi:DNA polymerase III subunit gamma/tau [Roseomonas sp. CAU 1739]|uniref:DNA polymerase III subunit gamma/tau n=1 Tax=Roseomonas sp. CAU 1739 TaxID=3140364 RepID=UPI00325BA6E4